MPAVSTPAAEAAFEELVAHPVSPHAASGGDLLGCFASVVDPRARRGGPAPVGRHSGDVYRGGVVRVCQP
ncbi:MAG: hypothetical protein JO364_08275 [Pseudonocardiales bacterium]|nr:hypothetical protein [Pseudonocardiales bacterium]MBV9030294.1 hypothetical protein [Pseudonocardiales bacterium]